MLKKITTQGKEYPINFGYAALAEFGDDQGMTLGDMTQLGNFSALQLSQIISLCRSGLKHGARIANIDFEMSADDVGDLLSSNPDLLEQMMLAFGESMVAISKKKAPPKKSPSSKKK